MAGKFKRILVLSLLSVLALAAATIIVLGIKPTSPLPELTLPDGTTNRIKALTFGKEHSYSTDPVRDRLRRFAPKPLRTFVGKGILSASLQTPPDSLVIWMIRLNRSPGVFTPATAGLMGGSAEVHYITDCHGCTFQSSGSTRSLGTAGALIGIAFPTFPRSDPSIDYVIMDGRTSARTCFTVPNRFRVRPSQWVPETLPITKTNGDLVARLGAIQSVAWPQTPFDPEIELIRAPELELWQKGPFRFFDSVGNCLPAARGAFCTNESVWRVEASFFRKSRAHFRPDEMWRISNVAIPKPDGITRLHATKTLNGIEVGLERLQGALYIEPRRTNDLGSQPIPADALKLAFWSRRHDAESKLFIRGRDDKDRTLVVREPVVSSAGVPPGPREDHRFEIYSWPDSGTLTLEVIVQKPVRFEFFAGSNRYGR